VWVGAPKYLGFPLIFLQRLKLATSFFQSLDFIHSFIESRTINHKKETRKERKKTHTQKTHKHTRVKKMKVY